MNLDDLESEVCTSGFDRGQLAVYADALQSSRNKTDVMRGELIALDLHAEAQATAGRADASRADASRADASRADASDASRADASRADASDASRADASRADASRADASRADASSEQLDLVESDRRRAELLVTMLGDAAPYVRCEWGFLHASLDRTAADPYVLAKLLALPASAYLRGLELHGDQPFLRDAISLVAGSPRPRLAALAIAQPTGPDQATVAGKLAAKLSAAAPALRTLVVRGFMVFGAFPHPALNTLRVGGWNGIGSLIGEGAPLPAVERLDLAFHPSFGDRWPRPKASQLERMLRGVPALRRLDLSHNDSSEYLYGATMFDLLAFLRDLAIKKRLTHLRVSTISTAADLTALQSSLDKMPELLELEITRLASSTPFQYSPGNASRRPYLPMPAVQAPPAAIELTLFHPATITLPPTTSQWAIRTHSRGRDAIAIEIPHVDPGSVASSASAPASAVSASATSASPVSASATSASPASASATSASPASASTTSASPAYVPSQASSAASALPTPTASASAASVLPSSAPPASAPTASASATSVSPASASAVSVLPSSASPASASPASASTASASTASAPTASASPASASPASASAISASTASAPTASASPASARPSSAGSIAPQRLVVELLPAVKHLEARYRELVTSERVAWDALWPILDNLAWDNEALTAPERATVPAHVIANCCATIEDPAWRALALALRSPRLDSRVAQNNVALRIHRSWTY